jgi:GxxExxY protein
MSALKKYNDQTQALDNLSKDVVDAIFKVHQKLGAGYLESLYEDCLAIELADRGLLVDKQYQIKFEYNKQQIPTKFRLDLVVERQIIIELKAVDKMLPVYDAQIYSYLKASGLPMGFLVNFNVPLIKEGIKRFVPKRAS